MIYTTMDPLAIPYGDCDIRCSDPWCPAMVCGVNETVARSRAYSDGWKVAADGSSAECPAHRGETT